MSGRRTYARRARALASLWVTLSIFIMLVAGPEVAAAAALPAPARAAGIPATPSDNATGPNVTPEADSARDPEAVLVEITDLSALIIQPGEDLQVQVDVVAPKNSRLPEDDSPLVMQLRLQGQVPTNTLQLGQWLTNPAKHPGYIIDKHTVEPLAAGERRTITLEIDSAALPTRSTWQWGPRGLQVELFVGSTRVALDRSLVTLGNGEQAAAPQPFTLAVPLTPEVSTLDNGADYQRVIEQLKTGDLPEITTEENSPDGAAASPSARADAEQDAEDSTSGTSQAPATEPDPTGEDTLALVRAGGANASMVADPFVLSQVMEQTSTGDTPRQLMSALAATRETLLLPWADADVQAAVHHDSWETITHARALSADWRADMAKAGWPFDDIAVYWAAPGANYPQLQANPSKGQAALGALGESAASYFIPALDQQLVDALIDHSWHGVIASPVDLAPAVTLNYTPSARVDIPGENGVLPVVIPDLRGSALLSNQLWAPRKAGSGNLVGIDDAPITISPLDAAAMAVAQSAVIYRERPSDPRPLLFAGARRAVDRQTLARFSQAITTAGWLNVVDLSTMVDLPAGTHPRTPLPQRLTDPGEFTAEGAQAAHRLRVNAAEQASIFSDDGVQLAAAGAAMANGYPSLAYRADGAARDKTITNAEQSLAQLTSSISVEPSSTLNLISEEASLPVHISNPLGVPVKVQVHLQPQDQRLRMIRPAEVTLNAQSTTLVLIDVKAVGLGDLPVKVTLLAPSGTEIGTPDVIKVRVRADWENTGTAIILGILAILFIIGTIRTIRRGRRMAPQTSARQTSQATDRG